MNKGAVTFCYYSLHEVWWLRRIFVYKRVWCYSKYSSFILPISRLLHCIVCRLFFNRFRCLHWFRTSRFDRKLGIHPVARVWRSNVSKRRSLSVAHYSISWLRKNYLARLACLLGGLYVLQMFFLCFITYLFLLMVDLIELCATQSQQLPDQFSRRAQAS